MDRKLQQSQEIERLIQAAQIARSFLGTEAILLKQRLDVPTRIRSSLRSNPTGWLVGSAVSGLVASLMLRRRRRVVVEKKRKSFPHAVLGLTLTAVQPLAKVWLSGQLKSYLARSSAKASSSRPTTTLHSPDIL